jgi:uncharacterized protein (TIGR02266 family)
MSAVAVDKVRIPFVQRVRLRVDGAPRDAFAVDLGLEGVFVETPPGGALGAALEVEFKLPGNAIPLRAAVRVAWTRLDRRPHGVGLQFVEMNAKDRERLHAYLLRYCEREGRGRRFARAWPAHGGGEGAP